MVDPNQAYGMNMAGQSPAPMQWQAQQQAPMPMYQSPQWPEQAPVPGQYPSYHAPPVAPAPPAPVLATTPGPSPPIDSRAQMMAQQQRQAVPQLQSQQAPSSFPPGAAGAPSWYPQGQNAVPGSTQPPPGQLAPPGADPRLLSQQHLPPGQHRPAPDPASLLPPTRSFQDAQRAVPVPPQAVPGGQSKAPAGAAAGAFLLNLVKGPGHPGHSAGAADSEGSPSKLGARGRFAKSSAAAQGAALLDQLRHGGQGRSSSSAEAAPEEPSGKAFKGKGKGKGKEKGKGKGPERPERSDDWGSGAWSSSGSYWREWKEVDHHEDREDQGGKGKAGKKGKAKGNQKVWRPTS